MDHVTSEVAPSSVGEGGPGRDDRARRQPDTLRRLASMVEPSSAVTARWRSRGPGRAGPPGAAAPGRSTLAEGGRGRRPDEQRPGLAEDLRRGNRVIGPGDRPVAETGHRVDADRRRGLPDDRAGPVGALGAVATTRNSAQARAGHKGATFRSRMKSAAAADVGRHRGGRVRPRASAPTRTVTGSAVTPSGSPSTRTSTEPGTPLGRDHEVERRPRLPGLRLNTPNWPGETRAVPRLVARLRIALAVGRWRCPGGASP